MHTLIAPPYALALLALTLCSSDAASAHLSCPQEAPSIAEARAQLEADSPIELRARAVLDQIVEKPELEEDWFTKEFLDEVPKSRLAAILRRTFKTTGAVSAFRGVSAPTEYAGRFRASCELGYEFILTLGVEAQAPHRINTLFISASSLASYAQVGTQLSELPGLVSFAVHRLEANAPERVFSLNPEQSLGVGSAFKLYLLGTLAQEVSAGKRAWRDTIELRDEYKSLPSGILHTWPTGAPVTLYTLAALMISQSDNTATDHLLFTLGRERVEAQLATMGSLQIKANAPFLSTAEMFRLKASDGGARAKTYLELNSDERRAYLRDVIAAVPVSQVHIGTLLKPTFIDTIEWFASADDIARALDWLRRSIEAGDETSAGILSINPGAVLPPDTFRYLGFKGGSEGGVLNLSFLVQTHDKRWWTVVGSWNNSADVVSTNTLLELCNSALLLCARDAEISTSSDMPATR